jgi:hypothetical protein
MRVLVCGGRDFGDLTIATHLHNGHKLKEQKYAEHTFIHRTLDALLPDDCVVIQGRARGVDTAAEQWAWQRSGRTSEPFPADWDKYGKSAGYIRNAKMLSIGKPDLVVAFPGGKGTAMMIDLARKAGVEVKEITYDPPEVEEAARRPDPPVGL